MTGERRSPEELLAVVQAQERREQRGRLHVYLGYCVGVGKTYAMLAAARQRQREGIDVVVASVDTHGRPETEELLAGIEMLPRKLVPHREIWLEELDLEAVLARRPQLVVVDELAHANAPGSKHRKRWQDVEEILQAGIDVYTSLNIQHLESLNDVVTQITRVRVKETVPDRVLDEAEDIKLIDLPPEELLARLESGKIYLPTQARYAVANFFGPAKLAALRELALRRAAERVDAEMRAHMQLLSVSGPWPAGERLLVGVGRGPRGEQLVRAAARLASQLQSKWDAVHVAPEASDPDQEEWPGRSLALAESLGARVERLPGQDVPTALLGYARAQNVTKIVVGRSSLPSGWLGRSLTDRIIDASGDVDVLVLTEGQTAAPPQAARPPWWRWLSGYGAALLLVLVVSGVGALAEAFLAPTNLVMFYLLAVTLAALHGGRGPAAVAAAASVAAFNFFFVEPRHTLHVHQPGFLFTFASLLLVGLVVGDLTARVRAQVQDSRRNQLHLLAAFGLSRELAQAGDEEAILRSLSQAARVPLAKQSTVLRPEADRMVVHRASVFPVATSDELAVADWVYRNGRPAGCGTDTLSALPDLYLPIRQGETSLAVFRVLLEARPLSPAQRQLLDVLLSLAAMSLGRARLAEEGRRAHLLEEAERLQSKLIGSISQDLQTPITTLLACLEGLSGPEAEESLLQRARDQAARLRGRVENLLDMTRVEAGQARIKKEPCDLSDLLGSALGRLEDAYRDREVVLDVRPDFPLISVDFVSFSRVLYNLLENAARFSPTGSAVEVSGRVVDKSGRRAEVRVIDRGPGIPETERERIFDKFYRASQPESGTGLGLAIARKVVELHGGSLTVEAAPGGGSAFVIDIPLEETT